MTINQKFAEGSNVKAEDIDLGKMFPESVFGNKKEFATAAIDKVKAAVDKLKAASILDYKNNPAIFFTDYKESMAKSYDAEYQKLYQNYFDALYGIPALDHKFLFPEETIKKAISEGHKMLLRHGWTQNAFSSLSGGFCSGGALNFALTGEPQQQSGLMVAAMARISDHLKLTPSYAPIVQKANAVVKWNDHPARTKDEVIKAFEMAAA